MSYLSLTGWRDGKRFWPIVSLWLALVNAIFYIEAVLS